MSALSRRNIIELIPSVLIDYPKVVFAESLIALVVAWMVFAYGLGLEETISSPILVGESMYALLVTGAWIPDVTASFRRVIYGFTLTVIVGTAVGVTMGWSPFWETALKDYIIVGMALPSLFAAVFAAMWFGFTDLTPMIAGAIISFPFLTQNVYEGMKDIDDRLISMSRAFDTSRRRVLRRVIIPSVLPEWFAGTRYAFAICFKITTLAELIVSEVGIGFRIQEQLSLLSITGVLTWTFFFTVIIMVTEYGIFRQIEKRLFEWREKASIGFA